MSNVGMRPSDQARRAASDTWQELGPDFPPDQRLQKSVDAAFAQVSSEAHELTWKGVLVLVILAGTFLATVAIFHMGR